MKKKISNIYIYILGGILVIKTFFKFHAANMKLAFTKAPFRHSLYYSKVVQT